MLHALNADETAMAAPKPAQRLTNCRRDIPEVLSGIVMCSGSADYASAGARNVSCRLDIAGISNAE